MKLFFLAILLGFNFVVFSQDWKAAYAIIETDFSQGKYADVLLFGDECLDLILEEFGEKDTNYCNTLFYLQNAHFYTGDFQGAVDVAQEENLLRLELQGKEHMDYLSSAYYLAVFSTYVKDYRTAIIQMNIIKKGYKKEFGINDPSYLNVANQYANICDLAGSFELAMREYEEVYSIIKANYTYTDSIFQAMTNTISTFYYTHGHFHLSEPFFTGALKHQEQVAGKESEVYLLTLNNTGEFYLAAGMYQKAEMNYREQVKVSSKFYGKKSADYATSLNNLAVTLENQDKLEEADELYQKALILKAKIFKKESNFYALTLMNYGILKYRMGHYKESEKHLLETMSIYEKIMSNNSSEYITATSHIALVWQNYGELEKANDILKKSMEVTKKNFGEDNLDFVSLIEILGNVLVDQGKLKEGDEWIQKALSIREKIQGKEHPDYATTLTTLARIKSYSGNFKVAENLLKKVLDIRMKKLGTETLDIASTYSELANVMYGLGNVSEARKHHDFALSEAKKVVGNMHPDYIVYLSNAGIFYMEIGELNQALALFDEALQKGKLAYGEDALDLYYIYNNLGNLYIKNGDYKLAEKSFQKSISIIEKKSGKNSTKYATTMNNMGVLYYQLGNYKKSEKYYSLALPVYKEIYGKHHAEYSNICNSIGALYMGMGIDLNFEADRELYLNQAENFFNKVLAIDSATIGVDHLDFATHLNNVAELLRYKNQPDSAEVYYLAGIKIEEKLLGKNNSNSGASYNNLALLFLGKKEFKKAEVYAKKSLESFYQLYGDKAGIVPNAKTTLAYLYLEKKDFQNAFRMHKEIIEKKYEIVNRNFSFLSEEEQAHYLEDFRSDRNNFFDFVHVSKETNPEISKFAYDISLFEKGLLLKSTQKMRTSILASKNEEALAKYDHWIGLKQELARIFSKPNVKDEIKNDLEERCNILERELVASSSEFSKRKSNQLNWKEVANQLKEKEVAIEFILYERSYFVNEIESHYAAVIVGKNKSPQYIELFEASELENIIGELAGNDIVYVSGLYGDKEMADIRLYQLLWSKLDTILQDVETIYYSPSGLLNKISFAAIRDDKGRYLSEKHRLVQLNSTEHLPSNQNLNIGNKQEVVVFGGAKYSLENTENKVWKYLEGTKTEADHIGEILNNAKVHFTERVGMTATEENFKLCSSENSPSILHIATHGFFYPDPLDLAENTEVEQVDVNFRGGSRGHEAFVKNANPLMRSGLVLTGANNVWNHRKDSIDLNQDFQQEDGVITAFEIASLNLSNTKLAVLSACETGLGDIKGSEGVYGLQRAFKIAGVKSIIMSLWQVPDKETEEFMGLFYGALVKEKNIQKSFHIAQSKMRDKYDPYYWAAFVLVE